MADTSTLKNDAKKAAFEAAYKAALLGKPMSQGAVNKVYDQQIKRDNKSTNITGGIPAGSYTQQNPTYNWPVDNRTTQQKFDDAQKVYDTYTASEEYQKTQKQNMLLNAIQNVFAGSSSSALATAPSAPRDTKERELNATVEHYRQQLQAEEDQRIMDADLKELESWSDEDRRNLDRYIAEENQHAWNKFNPMLGTQFDTYVLNPIVEKYGLGKVRQMAETVRRNQNAETMGKVEEEAQNTANNRPWLGGTLGSAASVPANLVGSLTGTLGYVVEAGQRTGRYSTLDPNNIGNLPSVYGETVRSEVAQNIRGDEESTNWLRKLAALGYQGGMSALDSAARIAVSGGSSGVSSAIAASGAFSNGLRQYSQQGATPTQAAAMALTSAGLEYVTEKLPTEKVLSMFKGGNTKGAVREVLKQAFLVEPTSEEVNLFAGVAAETLILGDKSSAKQQIGEMVANGMSYEEAKAQYYKSLWKEAAQTYAVSAISGGLSSAGATVLGNSVNGSQPQSFIEATGEEYAAKMPAPEPKAPLTEGQQHWENAAAEFLGMNNQPSVDTGRTAQYDENILQQGGYFDGGREVRENQNWPIDQSSSGIRSTEVAGEPGTSDLYDGVEGDSERRSREVLQSGDYFVEYDDEFDHYDGRPTKDRGGNEISGETAKRLAGTTVVDKNNAPIAVFHGTPNMEFTAFEQGDSGFHFGTYDQAKKRIEGKHLENGKTSKSGRIFRTYLNIQRPVYVDVDIGEWSAPAVAMLMESNGIFTAEEANTVKILAQNGSGYNSPASMQLRNLMDAKGYDGISYPNLIEGEGNSYMVFHNDQIVQSNIQYLDDDGNAYADTSGSRYKDPKTGKPAIKGTGAAEQNFSGNDQNAVGAAASQFKREVKNSKVYENTYQNATDEETRSIGAEAKKADPNIAKYDAVTEAESLHEAELRTRTEEERAAEFADLISKNSWSGSDNDTAMRLLKDFRKEEKTEEFLQLAKKQREMGTKAGQMIQSFAKYSREDAVVAVQDAIEDLDKLSIDQVSKRFWKDEQTASGKDGRQAAFENWKKEISKDMLGVANDIENVKDGDKKAMIDIVQQLANFRRTTAWAGNSSDLTQRTDRGISKMDFDTLKTVAKTQLSMIPSDFRKRNAGEIAKAIRVQNMLFTLTTKFKNDAGNITNGIMDAVSDSTSGRMVDAILGKITGMRTVGNDVRYAPEYIRAARNAADVAAAFVSLDIPMEADAKYSSGKTRTWSPNSGMVGRMMSAYEKHMKYALEVSDKFYEGGTTHTVRKSLERLGEKSGLTTEQINSLAEKTGERRTFKDPGYSVDKKGNARKGRALARTNVGLQKALNNVGTENIGLGDLLMPFAAVSGEVKQVGLDYTGGGLVSGIREISSIIKDVKNGMEIDPYRQRSAATNFGRGMTGIGLIAAFTAMAAAGAFKVNNDRDNEERIMGQTQGLSGAQWNLDSSLRWLDAITKGSSIESANDAAGWNTGDTLVSVDFLEPYNSLMHIGYILSQDEDITIADAGKAVLQGNFEALLEMPMMETLSDLADLQQSFTEVSDGDFSGVLDATGQLVGTVAGSAVPNWVRKTAQVVDPYYRDTYDTNPLKKAGKELVAAIPFASQMLPKKYDTLGKEQRRYDDGDLIDSTIDTMVTPWDTNTYETNEVYQEIKRLNSVDGVNVTPPRAKRVITYTDKNGERHENYNLTAEEYDTMQRAEGQTAARIIGDLTSNADYATLTDAQKAKVIGFAYDYAREQGRVDAIADYKGYSESWMKNISGKEAKAIVNKVVGAELSNSMSAITNAWTNKYDTSEAIETLDAAYDVYKDLSMNARKAVKDDATGRMEAYLEARNNNIRTETFVDLYKTYWELDNSRKKASEKANEWAYTLERAQESGKLTEKQKDIMKDALSFSQFIPVEAAKFDEMTGAGLNAQAAQDTVKAISNLTPEEGYSQVRDVQNWDAICAMTIADAEKITAMRAYMTDKQEEKLDEVIDMGFDVDDYPEIYRIIDAYTSGTGKKARTIKYLQKEYGIEYAAAKKLYEVFK